MSPVRVVAVVAAYRPDDGLGDRLDRFAPDVVSTLVVDDGSAAALPVGPGIETIVLAENRGIAAALNAGIARARELGATHVLTLDQDTTLSDGYLAKALEVFSRGVATRVGAAVVDAINGVPSVPTWISPEGIGLAPEAIQSGMLVSVACLDDAGDFDVSLFIDGVDHEFCHRIRARGWAVAIATGTDIEHTIGRLEPLRTGRDGEAVERYEWHEPFRQYYIVRNAIVLARRFRRVEPDWARATLRRMLTDARRITANGPRRLKHAIASAAGAFDGVFGRGGRIPRVIERLVR